jgi:hypothetical protein
MAAQPVRAVQIAVDTARQLYLVDANGCLWHSAAPPTSGSWTKLELPPYVDSEPAPSAQREHLGAVRGP